MSNSFINALTTPDQAAIAAADMIVVLLRNKPQAVIGLATGNTMLPLYEELVRSHKEDGLDFSQATFFNLDEFIGLPAAHPASFHAYMYRNFFDHVNAQPENIHIPDGEPKNLVDNAYRYERAIECAGGIDLQLLGLGANGHIGFNEPGTPFYSRMNQAELTEETRQSAAASFGGEIKDVPKFAITLGINNILNAHKIVLLATGSSKARAVREMLCGKISPQVPATALRTHPGVNFLFDTKAFRLVKQREVKPQAPSPA